MTNASNTQHSLGRSFLLHIVPGLLTALVFVLLKPLLEPTGYPPLLAFLLAVTLVDIPFMLGVMLFAGKKHTGRYSLKGVLLYRQKLSWKTFALIFVGAFVIVYLLVMLVTPLSAMLTEAFSSRLPAWIFLEQQTQYESYARPVLLVVFSLQLVLTGLVLPWVEELYFRGYLLPRIDRFRGWAPLIGGLFFGLYHAWQWFGFPTVFLLGSALGYVVWWKKDLRLSIGLHVLANLLSRVMFLLAALMM